ncbi:MAG: DNA mismatch repair endonuclease MutL, partial [Oscillospiraceae bacterium]|nr:DNA mismatch repair endonuclease MutL [Oscillospiraceae bacterium]
MPHIQVLDKHTAELIAAGEVVERPASVVKELTENALDAGAKKITVSIERGGISMIEIQDDGEGVAPEDMPTAFIRHATSKIKTGEDLEHIMTLGFRGEALASIAAVSRVTLLSKTGKEEFAYRYQIDGGEEISFEEAARPQGTTITVRELFYNTPARMKFLKKDVSEGNYVGEAMTRLALSHPEVSFRFIKDGKEQFFTPGDGKLKSAVSAALSRDFAKDLTAVEFQENGMRLSGYVTPPRAARASRAMQHFFVNARYIKNRTLSAALENAYRGMLMAGRFPGCVLNIEMPPEKVDVNVHPAKTEVRFSRESEIFELLYKGVKNALMRPETMESRFSFPAEKAPDKKTQEKKNQGAGAASPGAPVSFSVSAPLSPFREKEETPSQKKPPQLEGLSGGSAFGVNGHSFDADSAVMHSEPLNLYRTRPDRTERPFASGVSIDVTAEEPVALPVPEETPQQHIPAAPKQLELETAPAENAPRPEALRLVGEVFRTYIVAQRGDELCFIDKHAAHERLIYEQLKKNYGHICSQMLLAPVTVTLSAGEKNALLGHAEYLKDFGLEAEDFGGNAVLVRAVPADITPDSVEDLAVELGRKLSTGAKEALSEKTEWVLHSISCRAAVKAGDKNQQEEMLALAREIIDGEAPAFCPHGRPVV